jgi:hypothetical protein
LRVRVSPPEQGLVVIRVILNVLNRIHLVYDIRNNRRMIFMDEESAEVEPDDDAEESEEA